MPDKHRTLRGTLPSSDERLLNIGIDVRGLEVESSLRRGIGRYVMNLLRTLAGNYRHQLCLFGDWPPWQVRHFDDLVKLPNVSYATYCPSFADDLDVFLLTDPAPVMVGRKLIPFPLNGTPCATIFYDLIPLAFREKYLDKNAKLRDEYLRHLEDLKVAVTHYLTISEFVAQDLRERLGIEKNRLVPILGGLDDAFAERPSEASVQSTLDRFNIRKRYFFYTGGADFRKNLAALLLAFQKVRSKGNPDLVLALSGEISEGWLKNLERESQVQVADNVKPLGYVTDDELRGLYAGAVGFVFPSLYEGFGLPALEAMACGCPVIVSDGSSLREIVGDSGLKIDPTSIDDIADKMLQLAGDPLLANELREKGLRRAARYTWNDVARLTEKALWSIALKSAKPRVPSRRMRVVIQNRDNAFIAPGGDTMVMEELYSALRAFDVDVDIAAGTPDLDHVDFVHLVNLTVRSVTEEVAANAMRQRVPYAITTLFEDWPQYLEPSHLAMRLFHDYTYQGRDEVRFRKGLEELRRTKAGMEVGCTDAAMNAAALFACGESEAFRLAHAYPEAEERIHIAHFGIRPYPDVNENNIAIAKEKIGFDRFILCCGRLETRKNQLMLLKALQDWDIPIVFLAGGFTYQEAYADLVTRFPTRTPVKILGRQGRPFLWNTMAAASVHVLPSWYELPGLVTLEAAAAGTAVVASDWGAIRDYLSDDLVHICQPDDPESIRRAVEAALRDGPNPAAQEKSAAFTWDAFGRETYEVYERILSRSASMRPRTQTTVTTSEKYSTPEAEMQTPAANTHSYDVSIIIPVFNHAHLTRECLEAISALQDRSTFELIIVDNHSTDETPQLLQALEGDVTVLRHPENRGFASACNSGARVAYGEYLIFLNNDTRPLTGWIDALVNRAKQDPSIGAVGAKLVYPEGDIQHAGVAFNARRIPYHIFQHFGAEHPAVNEAREMKAVTAACMLVPSHVFKQLNGFDEGYRNGFEDIDFCMRLARAGFRIMYEPNSVVVHREETSQGRKDFDSENLHRFLSLWGEKIEPDENTYLTRHGYTLTWQNGVGRYQAVQSSQAEQKNEMSAMNPSLAEARDLYAAGDIEAAANMLKRVVESRMVLAGDEEFEAWQTLGNCLASLKRPVEAEQAYHAAIKINPDSERPYLGLGTVAMLQENWQAAMFGFMTALAKNPNAMKGEFGVGLSMAARNMHAEAIAHFSRVLDHEPLNAEALFYLYRSAMESGQPRLAIEPIEQYLRARPDDTNFMFNLCGAYWKAGELARATDLCNRVLEREPNHAAAKDVLEHLKTSKLVHA